MNKRQAILGEHRSKAGQSEGQGIALLSIAFQEQHRRINQQDSHSAQALLH